MLCAACGQAGTVRLLELLEDESARHLLGVNRFADLNRILFACCGAGQHATC
jgi:hypothetical protein